ncbi:MAG: hypothetical protein RMZ69_33695 [Nostoc sp. ChiQUE01a]|nr:hypothetical protein [Nostoc sp. ChiQUE01a]
MFADNIHPSILLVVVDDRGSTMPRALVLSIAAVARKMRSHL